MWPHPDGHARFRRKQVPLQLDCSLAGVHASFTLGRNHSKNPSDSSWFEASLAFPSFIKVAFLNWQLSLCRRNVREETQLCPLVAPGAENAWFMTSCIWARISGEAFFFIFQLKRSQDCGLRLPNEALVTSALLTVRLWFEIVRDVRTSMSVWRDFACFARHIFPHLDQRVIADGGWELWPGPTSGAEDCPADSGPGAGAGVQLLLSLTVNTSAGHLTSLPPTAEI